MGILKEIFFNFEKKFKETNKELRMLPSGSLIKRGKFYTHLDKNKEVGISKKHDTIQSLCRKKFLQIRKKQLKKNISLMKIPISKLDITTDEEIIRSLPAAYQGLPDSYFLTHTSIKKWATATYRKNPYKREQATLTSNNGVSLRSKSEVFIANQLEYLGIPYRYEAEFKLGNKIIYPDFIVINPDTGETFLWEHYGMLHEEEYVERMYTKMKLYRDQGYCHSDNIIFTFEPDIEKAEHLRALIIKRILKK